MKKSQVAIQFHWIFVLIVGAIILTFFITIAIKQKNVSQQSLEYFIQTDLDAILTGAEVSTGTASIVEIPDVEIEFGCQGFKVGSQPNLFFPYAFAPSLIKSSRQTISLWSYPWSTPFRVTNFLFVTSPDIRYIIIDDNTLNDNSLAEELDELLPPTHIEVRGKSRLFMNRELLTSMPSEDLNNYKVRFIFFNTKENPPAFKKTKNKDMTAVVIKGADLEKGEVEFYEKGPTGWINIGNSNYVGKAALLAAIFSEKNPFETEHSYICGIERAFEKLGLVTKIYKIRAEALRSNYSSEDQCNSLINSAVNTLDTIEHNSSSIDNYNNIATQATLLKDQNQDIQQNSCPSVY